MDTLDVPVCRASIVTADLLTQSHSHTTSQTSPGVSACSRVYLQRDKWFKESKGRISYSALVQATQTPAEMGTVEEICY